MRWRASAVSSSPPSEASSATDSCSASGSSTSARSAHDGRSSSSSPGDADGEDRPARPLRELLDQVEQRRLRPVHVLEHEQQRTLAGERLEEAADGPSALAGGCRALGEPDQLEHALRYELAVVGLRQDRPQSRPSTISRSGRYVAPSP